MFDNAVLYLSIHVLSIDKIYVVRESILVRCRREGAGCFVLLNISLSLAGALKMQDLKMQDRL